jgi:hypothetical protein
MEEVRDELLLVLSSFRFEAALMPRPALPLTGDGATNLLRMNELVPNAVPHLDIAWKNLGSWEKLVGTRPIRVSADYLAPASGPPQSRAAGV